VSCASALPARLPLFDATLDVMAMKRCAWAGDDALMERHPGQA
jgi:hypothetical protein